MLPKTRPLPSSDQLSTRSYGSPQRGFGFTFCADAAKGQDYLSSALKMTATAAQTPNFHEFIKDSLSPRYTSRAEAL